METLVFREVASGKTFTAKASSFRYLGSPMQDIRDSVPANFRSATDWAALFAGEEAEPAAVPDSYAPALKARARAEAVAERVKRTSGNVAQARLSTVAPNSIDGYAKALNADAPTVAAAPINELDGYLVGLRARGVVYQFPVPDRDGYRVALARRKES